MKTDNFNHAEKVLVLGAGQLGAAVLDALVPAVIERQGTVSVIVSPAAWDEAGQLRSANHQALADAGATFLAVDIAGSAMETLADQFRGFTTVINCMGFVAGPGTQLKITRAVLAAGYPAIFPGSLASITMWSAKAAVSRSGTSSAMSGPCCARSGPRSGSLSPPGCLPAFSSNQTSM